MSINSVLIIVCGCAVALIWLCALMTKSYPPPVFSIINASREGRFPAVYVHFGATHLQYDHYLFVALTQAVRYHDDVVLIANASAVNLPAELTNRVQIVDARTFDSDEATKRFRDVYLPVGIGREPWERENIERYFVLAAWMRLERVRWVFYADSDVALNGTIPSLYNFSACDAIVSMRPLSHAHELEWKRLEWIVWAGTSILSLPVLENFVSFTIQLYTQSRFVELILTRSTLNHMPFTDMAVWYLFSAASMPAFRGKWHVHAGLPAVPHAQICDAESLSIWFNYQISDIDDDCSGQIWRTIHFQGERKSRMAPFFSKMSRSPLKGEGDRNILSKKDTV